MSILLGIASFLICRRRSSRSKHTTSTSTKNKYYYFYTTNTSLLFISCYFIAFFSMVKIKTCLTLLILAINQAKRDFASPTYIPRLYCLPFPEGVLVTSRAIFVGTTFIKLILSSKFNC